MTENNRLNYSLTLITVLALGAALGATTTALTNNPGHTIHKNVTHTTEIVNATQAIQIDQQNNKSILVTYDKLDQKFLETKYSFDIAADTNHTITNNANQETQAEITVTYPNLNTTERPITQVKLHGNVVKQLKGEYRTFTVIIPANESMDIAFKHLYGQNEEVEMKEVLGSEIKVEVESLYTEP